MFTGGSDGKETACSVGDLRLVSELGWSPGERILAWRIPLTEEPSILQSMGSQRVKHDWVTDAFTFKKGTVLKFKQNSKLWKFIWEKYLSRTYSGFILEKD